MKIIHGLEAVPHDPTPTAVAIGVFDGVHRGHQEILRRTVRAAGDRLTPLALTFDIHPTELFAPDQAPPYLASLEQRARWIGEYGGVGTVLLARFDRPFAALPPGEFITHVLLDQLGARHVLVGDDFRYGRGRAGTAASLQAAGAAHGFAVTIIPPFVIDGARVSSTRIRERVAAGDLETAARLLGHPFVLAGTVVEGKRLGRTLGYPTANLRPVQPGQILPEDAVYAAWAVLADGSRHRAAVSVGTNPTTDADDRRKVEAYLMDGFSGDLYGQPIELEFAVRVRGQVQFEGLDALVRQIGDDVRAVEKLLAK